MKFTAYLNAAFRFSTTNDTPSLPPSRATPIEVERKMLDSLIGRLDSDAGSAFDVFASFRGSNGTLEEDMQRICNAVKVLLDSDLNRLWRKEPGEERLSLSFEPTPASFWITTQNGGHLILGWIMILEPGKTDQPWTTTVSSPGRGSFLGYLSCVVELSRPMTVL